MAMRPLSRVFTADSFTRIVDAAAVRADHRRDDLGRGDIGQTDLAR
jgi:hypothetical protein